MKSTRIIQIKICLIAAFVFFVNWAFADTLIFKNGKEEKGLIVKEFSDRLVFSTIEGQREVLLSTVRSIIYDDEERRLLQMGRNQIKRQEYVNAYRTFEEVIKIDPDNEEAIERMMHLRNYLENTTYTAVEKGVKNDLTYFEGEVPEEPEDIIKKNFGIVLNKDDGFFFVSEVDRLGSEYGFKEGDLVVSIWGENIKFSEIPEVARLLMSSREVHVDVERQLSVKLAEKNIVLRILGGYNIITGATLNRDRTGLVVRKVIKKGSFSKAGISEGDIILDMNGIAFEYMPLKNVISMIIRNHGKKVKMTIRRKLTFWRKGQ